MIEKETIALVWVMSIGIAALLSSIMLVHERTQNWSERKIVNLPHSVKEQLIDLTNKACDTVDVIPPALDCIVELLETSFADKKKKEEYCGYVNELDIKEEITDHVVIEIRKRLLDVEKEFTHGEFYLMMRLTRQLARVADHAENCGDRMRVMIARQ